MQWLGTNLRYCCIRTVGWDRCLVLWNGAHSIRLRQWSWCTLPGISAAEGEVWSCKAMSNTIVKKQCCVIITIVPSITSVSGSRSMASSLVQVWVGPIYKRRRGHTISITLHLPDARTKDPKISENRTRRRTHGYPRNIWKNSLMPRNTQFALRYPQGA